MGLSGGCCGVFYVGVLGWCLGGVTGEGGVYCGCIKGVYGAREYGEVKLTVCVCLCVCLCLGK